MLVNPENVFDIARGITEVLTNEDLRQDLIEKGHRQAESFSWARTAREVLELYEEIGGQSSRSSSAARKSDVTRPVR